MANSQHSAETPAAATALAPPPDPPSSPPNATGAKPAPGRRRWIGWVVGILSIVIVVGGLAGVVVWALGRGTTSTDFSAYRPGFESAMAKAGTEASFPDGPVELDGVSATGNHSFEATFTAEEITALANVFRWSTSIQGTPVAVSGTRVTFPSAGAAGIRTTAKVNGSSYSGSLEGPVEYKAGTLTSTGATKVVAEGFPVTGDRATQATRMLLVYLNAYLAAAPGLRVDSATVTEAGVQVTGTAPDSLSLH